MRAPLIKTGLLCVRFMKILLSDWVYVQLAVVVPIIDHGALRLPKGPRPYAWVIFRDRNILEASFLDPSTPLRSG